MLRHQLQKLIILSLVVGLQLLNIHIEGNFHHVKVLLSSIIFVKKRLILHLWSLNAFFVIFGGSIVLFAFLFHVEFDIP